MEIYFNPYPNAASNMAAGRRAVLDAADALRRLQDECQDFIDLKSVSSNMRGDRNPARFVVVRNADSELALKDLIGEAPKRDREKLTLLLSFFSRGQIMDELSAPPADGWVLSIIGAEAPFLEAAAKNKALTLTFAPADEWRIDILRFEGREEKLPNIWGQTDISKALAHCQE